VRCGRLLKVAREIRKPFVALGYTVHQSLAVGVAQSIMDGARLLSPKTPMVLVPDEPRGWLLFGGRHTHTCSLECKELETLGTLSNNSGSKLELCSCHGRCTLEKLAVSGWQAAFEACVFLPFTRAELNCCIGGRVTAYAVPPPDKIASPMRAGLRIEGAAPSI